MSNRRFHRAPSALAARQRGVVLLFSLIALVIMLIAAAAMVRSFNSSLFTAGNIGFKRDLQNQSERAVVKALAAFSTGALSTAAARSSNSTASNYSAEMLAVNAQGIPLALTATAFTVGVATNDITPSNEPSLANQGVSIRYVIDRMCSVTGLESSTFGAANCMLGNSQMPAGTSSSNLQGAGQRLGGQTPIPQSVVYRLSVMVTGPRNTQSFFQSTFNVPS